MTETVLLDPADPAREAEQVARVVAALDAGALVLAPTEAVYGVVGRADDADTLARLERLAGAGEPASARLVLDLAQAEAAGGVVTTPARRAARRYWPGPLALVLDREGGGLLAVRAPGAAFLRRVVAASARPLALADAPGGASAALALAALEARAGGAGVDLVVDGGPTPLGARATAVRAPRAGRPGVLTPGFLDAAPLERLLVRRVLFVCTGNTCRSPMAEAILRARLARRLGVAPDALAARGWEVGSAGVAAEVGGPAADHAREVVRRTEGADLLAAHAARQVDADLVLGADFVLGMTGGHLDALLDWFPEAAGRAFLLDPRGVPDPVGRPYDVYEATAAHMARRIEPLLDVLLADDAALMGAPVHDPAAAPEGEAT